MGKVERVDADLTLVYDRTLVLLHEFDRILECDDVPGFFLVQAVDHRSKCSRLTGTGWAGNQDESVRYVGHVQQHLRKSQGIEVWNLARDLTEDCGHRTFRVEAVGAES